MAGKVAIRADSSVEIGTGHVMRCLALAERLRSHGYHVVFVTRSGPGNVNSVINEAGFRACVMPPGDAAQQSTGDGTAHASWLPVDWRTDAMQTREVLAEIGPDWLIVDHYALDRRWESHQRQVVGHILAIDDLADREHDCDVLLDQNLADNAERRYTHLVPAGCVKLLGPAYAPVRAEFIAELSRVRHRDGVLRRLMVFMGGADVLNATVTALEAVNIVGRMDLLVDVVVGASNPRADQIRSLCSKLPNVVFLQGITNMAEVMNRADLAIAAGGTSLWERCLLGLPSVAVSIAANQDEQLRVAADAGCVVYLGKAADVSAAMIADVVSQLAGDPPRVRRLSAAARALVPQNRSEAIIDALKQFQYS